MKLLKFSELSIGWELQQAITDMGFTEATPIQSGAIPPILQGKDVIGQAQTGTGKTAAFGIPLLEKLEEGSKSVTAVVLCPTRELSLQVAGEIKKLAKYKKGAEVLAVYGGESIQKQIKALKRGVQVVVGTPGRVIDHLERKTLSFDKVNVAVLDEADEMLNMGFRDDIENILRRMPAHRQTILFSATMPKAILDITHKYQRSPVMVKVSPEKLTAASIEQVYFETRGFLKTKLMANLIDLHGIKLALVFCNTKRKVDDLVKELKTIGVKADGIHGDLRQNQREAVLAAFRGSALNVLVATDVAARGIDVSNVDAVFNYDLPLDPEYYVHRIGRTGRAGKTGKAFSFITGGDESFRLSQIERYAKIKIERRNIPTPQELMMIHKTGLLARLKKAASNDGLDFFKQMAEEYCMEGFTMDELAAALLKLTLPVPEKAAPPEEFRKHRDRDNDFGGGKREHRKGGFRPERHKRFEKRHRKKY
jgi:ATP-dependent RNA helicase DeaD